ncbi:hypothetical protein IWW50_001555 [Coemansia erecta]|nr:hypothetical protein IWW50_001555 [Coemansia erecta]
MPRVSRERTKYHASTRPGPASSITTTPSQTAVPANFFASILPKPSLDIVSTPIPLTTTSTPAQSTAPSPTTSATTSASLAPPKSKKGKRVERHKKWLTKLDTAKSLHRQQQRQQSRMTDKSALIRGMSQMHSSLRDVQAEIMAGDLLLSFDRQKQKSNDGNHNNSTSTKGCYSDMHQPPPVSRKARAKAAVVEEKRFAQVLQHPAFKADPLATIREHLANTLQPPSK